MIFSNKWFNKKLFFGFIFLVALLALIDWVLFGRTPLHEFQKVTEAAQAGVAKITGQHSGFAGAAQAHLASATAALQAPLTFEVATATPEQFKIWFDSEVKIMDQYNVNTDQLQQRYLELTAKMKPEQFSKLSVIARTKSDRVNERVLAAYLLGYAGYANISDLAALVQAEFKLDGEPTAHSAAETQQVQEQSLRVLAINRLADLARGDDKVLALKALAQLKLIVKNVKNITLKNYAQNKLNEISK